MVVGETLEESGEFAEEAANAVGQIPELAGLSGNALVQTFLFHQFSLLLLLVPIVVGDGAGDARGDRREAVEGARAAAGHADLDDRAARGEDADAVPVRARR